MYRANVVLAARSEDTLAEIGRYDELIAKAGVFRDLLGEREDEFGQTPSLSDDPGSLPTTSRI